ncbi:MAG: DUF3419 family protein [Proteobacteria bacterium]|nr:DUF3419 family protein [Pseudomonadota bacterium]
MSQVFKSNQIQFATVREDPQIEFEIFKRHNVKNPLIVGSGGCTLFSLMAKFSGIQFTVVEPNSAQIDLIQRKLSVLQKTSTPNLEQFGVSENRRGAKFAEFIECGNFESLFRNFRNFIFEFVIEPDELKKMTLKRNQKLLRTLFSHPYWDVAFQLYFSDSLLRAMFGPAAIQHAPKNSYPNYFKHKIEVGLLRSDANINYFLHHILFGHYFENPRALPVYLQTKVKDTHRITFDNRTLQKIDTFSKFDFVGLSNIFDWSSSSDIRRIADRLRRELATDSIVLYRQLNNKKDLRHYFGRNFKWQSSTAGKLFGKDRSLFYDSLSIGVKD